MENDNIRMLIDRFLQAETTIEEEEKLYRFFQSDIMPDDLKQYKEMFMAYSDLYIDKNNEIIDQIAREKTLISKTKNDKKIFKLYRKIGIAIAASLLLGVIAFSVYHQYENHRLEEIYGGSYIIIDGNKIDDLAKIKPQIIDGINKAAAMEKLCNTKAKQEEIESRFINNISDKREKEYIESLLSD